MSYPLYRELSGRADSGFLFCNYIINMASLLRIRQALRNTIGRGRK